MSEEKRKRTPEERREERARHEDLTRRLQDYLESRDIPSGLDRESFDERTRRLEAAIARRGGGGAPSSASPA